MDWLGFLRWWKNIDEETLISHFSCNFNIVSLHKFLIYECILGLLHPYGCFIRVRHSALNHLTPLTISRVECTAEQFVII